MLKNICKVHKREKNQWKVIDSADPVLAVLRHSLPKHCDKSAYATFFSPTSQCFIIKSFKHIAMSKELSGEHSYTHPSSTVVFSYICCLSQLFSHSWWFSGSWFILANILLNICSMYSSILRISEHSLQLISKALRGIYFQVWEFLFLSYAVFLKNIYLFVLFIFSPAEPSLVAASGGYFPAGLESARASDCGCVSGCRARLQGEWASVVAPRGLRRDPPRHLRSSPTRDRTCVPLHHKADS